MPRRPKTQARPQLIALALTVIVVRIANDTAFVLQTSLHPQRRHAARSGARRTASVALHCSGGSAVEQGVSLAAPGAAPQPAAPPEAAASELAARPSTRSFKKGQKLRGTVTKLLMSGIFVDVGADRDGWVHISKVGYGRVERPADVAARGQELEVWVVKVRGDGFLDLSCRPPVDLAGFRGAEEGLWLTGTISAIDWSGFYVKVQPPGGGEPQEGKVRRREIRRGWVKNPHAEAEVGEEVRVRVLGVDEGRGRLGLTMRGL